mmetsp:Transcript_3155/g.12809  ORF Transcript_3155/g.12809 Transcript_3155/m.12809 type:complete len:273 (+) Transcript_3155:293-1111(+)
MRRTVSRNCERLSQAALVTSTLVALQLCEELFTMSDTTLRAWYSMASSDHSPGVMIQGVTQPSSAVTTLSHLSFAPDLTLASVPPHMIASYVAPEPVMWMASTPSCPVRWMPCSAPPYTNSTKPRSTNGFSMRRHAGPMCSLTGFILITATRFSASNTWSASSTQITHWLPAPSTQLTPPLIGEPCSAARYTLPCVGGLAAPGLSQSSWRAPGKTMFSTTPCGPTCTTCWPSGRVVTPIGLGLAPASIVSAYSRTAVATVAEIKPSSAQSMP